MRAFVGLGAVLLALSGTMVVAAVPAGAVAKRCTTGTWKLTRAEHRTSRPGDLFWATTRGGAGERLKITGAGSLTYDFGRAAKNVTTGTLGGRKYTGWVRYRGKLKVKATLSGSRIRTRIKSASGGATYRIVVSAPSVFDSASRNLAPKIRSGDSDQVVAAAGTFTCRGRTLKISETDSYAAAQGGGGVVSTWAYRRV
ncbi:MAG: hypothetical protein ABIS86_01025 [Streptosporangiaceae bacterium]